MTRWILIGAMLAGFGCGSADGSAMVMQAATPTDAGASDATHWPPASQGRCVPPYAPATGCYEVMPGDGNPCFSTETPPALICCCTP